MDQRTRKAKRVLAVQQQLSRIEQEKLARLQRRLGELEAEQRELISALNADHALHGLFLDTMARRLGVIAEEMAVVAREKDMQSRRAIEQTTRAKLAQRLAERTEDEARRAEDRRELLEVIERFLGRPGTSLP